MHSIPLEEEDDDALPVVGEAPAPPKGGELELLSDMRGHVLAGRYVLVELLGSGDLGCVYAGRDNHGGQAVSVKVLAQATHRDEVGRVSERSRQRFGVRHPAVAAVLAEGTIGGLWYCVMEHAAGQNFYHVHGDPRLAGPGLAEVALRLVEGLVALHGAGAAHGAVTPGNIVWSESGVRLVDLGVQVSEESGASEPSPAADIRALAAVLLELASGREDEPPAWVAELAALARGEASPSAAQWAASLRAAGSPAKPAGPFGLVAPTVPPSFGLTATTTAAPFGLAAPEAPAGPQGHAPQDMTQETGPSEHVAGVVEALAEAVPEPAPEAARVEQPPAEAPAAEGEARPFAERAAFEPVRRDSAVEDDEWASAPRPRKRRTTGVVVGVIAVLALALIGWLATVGRETPQEPVPVEAPPRRSELPSEAPTLARVATAAEERAVVPAAPVEAAPGEAAPAPAEARPVESPPNEVVTTAESAAVEQLSAAEFRRIMLRTGRTPQARECYRQHGTGDVDVDVIALVGPRGKVQKLRMDETALGECLRKLVLRLEFPRAAKAAQHNFVFHPPED